MKNPMNKLKTGIAEARGINKHNVIDQKYNQEYYQFISVLYIKYSEQRFDFELDDNFGDDIATVFDSVTKWPSNF